MFFHFTLLVASLMSFLRCVSCCGANCADTPVFTPSRLVVKFGDPASANCSVCRACHSSSSGLENSVGASTTNGSTISWMVDRMTEWGTAAMCYYNDINTNDQCCSTLPVIVYQPPDNVSISFVNHTGPMSEGHLYTLQCTVLDVAPVENLIVTFYRGQTALGQPQSKNNPEKKPVTESFTFNIIPSKDNDGVQYWCEAELDLGPQGPQLPPVVMSQNITATVLFGPQFVCPTKLKVIEGERLSCEVRGNPQPSVTWFRDGQVVTLPTHSSRKNAGKYTVLANGLFGQKYFTVEVEVLAGSGTTNRCNSHFLSAVLLIQMINWP